FTIDDISASPTVTLTPVQNSDCSGTTANGSITASVTLGAGEVVGDYSFAWYYSTNANIGDVANATLIGNGDTYTNGTAYTVAVSDDSGFAGNVLSGLPENVAGEAFWVRVTDNTDPSSTCYADASETIADNPATIIITAATETDATQCTPVNGVITVDAITIDGTPTNTAAGFQSLQSGGYTFEVLQSDATTLEKAFNIAANSTGNIFPAADALNPGSYNIRIT
ncbi:MAG: hypothetical protein JXR03_19345, partial [Cyclobacteriaceae bacterium]